MKKLSIILFGPQGSGKSSQGKMLAKELGIPLLVMGDIFRAEIKNKTKIGKDAQQVLARGNLMPDYVSELLLRRELEKEKYKKGILLDGYPRTHDQAHDIDEIIKTDYAIYLKINDTLVMKRIGNRRSCDRGHVFSLIYNKPKKKGICDYDGLPLKKRLDDTGPVIKNRLNIFHKQTEPIIGHYRRRKKLITVDASGSIDKVNQMLMGNLKSKIQNFKSQTSTKSKITKF